MVINLLNRFIIPSSSRIHINIEYSIVLSNSDLESNRENTEK